MTAEDHNPYQAPGTASVDGANVRTEAERIRQDHWHHETSIRAMGQFGILIAACCTAYVLFVFYIEATTTSTFRTGSVPISATVVGPVVGLAAFIIGFGLSALKSWARAPAILLAAPGLIAFPIGTVICGYFLFLLFSKKGRFIFTSEFRTIREQTKHAVFTNRGVDSLVILSIIIALGVGWMLLA